MNPTDNQNQTLPINNTPQDGVNSIASKEEIPMSIEKVETTPEVETAAITETTPVVTELNPATQPVTSIFNQETIPSEIKNEEVSSTPLYNFQTNAINPNANVNINDFRIDESPKMPSISETSNLESTTIIPNTEQVSEQKTETVLSQNPEVVLESPITPANTEQTSQVTENIKPVTSSNTTMIAVLGVIIALGLVAGAYFVFFRKTQPTDSNYVAGDYKTEKILVSSKTEEKALTVDEYKATIKSYIERYNNNLRNSKVKLATPNLTVEQKLQVFVDYSSEILDIYTEIQNLRVPETFKESHDKLTLSLYAVNTLFDTLVIDYKNKTLTTENEKQILESIVKAEDVAAKAFNEIANSQ